MASGTTRYWRVDFSGEGGISAVTEISGPANAEWVVVEAPSYEGAKRAAYNLYCRRKKKLAKERLRASGKCCCGRAWDRKHPNGDWMLTCSVCAARHAVSSKASLERKAEGVTDHQRDESARVVANQNRQRDRRGEIRLETLIEVRQRWIDSRNVSLFGQWLISEIDQLTGADARKGAAA